LGEKVGALKLVRARTEEEEAFWRRLVLPLDDPRLPSCLHITSGYRWFRAANVIPIERWKRSEPDQKNDAAA
jgi:hypothetical protein